MQTWWQEQVISAFLLTRVTVGMAERHPRPLSTAQEVRKDHIWGTYCWSSVISFHYLGIQMEMDQKYVCGNDLTNY